jgi:hypothetical protein
MASWAEPAACPRTRALKLLAALLRVFHEGAIEFFVHWLEARQMVREWMQ